MSQEDYVWGLMREAMGLYIPGASPEADIMMEFKKNLYKYVGQTIDQNLISTIKTEIIQVARKILQSHKVKRLSGNLDMSININGAQNLRMLITNEDLGVEAPIKT